MSDGTREPRVGETWVGETMRLRVMAFDRNGSWVQVWDEIARGAWWWPVRLFSEWTAKARLVTEGERP